LQEEHWFDARYSHSQQESPDSNSASPLSRQQQQAEQQLPWLETLKQQTGGQTPTKQQQQQQQSPAGGSRAAAAASKDAAASEARLLGLRASQLIEEELGDAPVRSGGSASSALSGPQDSSRQLKSMRSL
jgi:hypothetical protein